MRLKHPSLLLFNIYAWPIAGLILVISGISTALIPGQQRRRQAARLSARIFLWLCGCKLTCNGLDRLPEGNSIIASNHASYLDGIILTAALPPNFSFVIKHELTRIPVMHFVLRRLGSEFVDRFDSNASRGSATRLMRKARDGHSLGMFPEGTFQEKPGLLPFRKGVFLTATRTGLPVVAVAIRGSRYVLPAHSWLISPGKINVEIVKSISVEGRDRATSEFLCEETRKAILSKLGEPDLAKPQ
ncbi:MAG: lysophospholipid acyltransferase family protein [Gammaproteobacteria bacterium]